MRRRPANPKERDESYVLSKGTKSLRRNDSQRAKRIHSQTGALLIPSKARALRTFPLGEKGGFRIIPEVLYIQTGGYWFWKETSNLAQPDSRGKKYP